MKKKKQWFLTVCAAVLLAAVFVQGTGLCRCRSLAYDRAQLLFGTANILRMYKIEEVEDLQEYADFAVQGIPLEYGEPYRFYKEGKLINGFTPVKLRVTGTFGEPHEIKVGDVIEIIEQYCTVEEEGETVLYYAPGYLPSDLCREYLYFIMDDEKTGEHKVGFGESGRYPVVPGDTSVWDIEDMTDAELNLGDEAEVEDYRSVFAEVIETYMK